MKKALVLLDYKIRTKKLKANFVCNCHDEWQIEVQEKDAELVGELAIESIKKAGEHFKLRCPLNGEYKIGRTWAETH